MNHKFVEKWQRADEEVQRKLPPGVKLVHTLRGHKGYIGRIEWSPDGLMLASPSKDKTIRLWDAETGECIRTLRQNTEYVQCATFDPTGRLLASSNSNDPTKVKVREIATGKVDLTLNWGGSRVWDIAFNKEGDTLAIAGNEHATELYNTKSGKLICCLEGQNYALSLAFDPSRKMLASLGEGKEIKLWDPTTGKLLRMMKGHQGAVYNVAFDPLGRTIASGSEDETIKIWELDSGRLIRTLEGHTSSVICLSFFANGQLLASKGIDNCVRLWSTETGDCVAEIPELSSEKWPPGLAFHPRLPLLATVGSDPDTLDQYCDRVIHIYKLDMPILLDQTIELSTHYINAKVMLVGDTGVGKTGLSLVMSNRQFEATDSTPSRCVLTFDSQVVKTGENTTQTRETLLWDLAGQPGYRIIHQLHLNEVAVALVVFDSRSETDPLAGVQYWERALRLAQQRQSTSRVSMKKFLVSARNDRGGVSISEERLQAILKEFNFDGYFKTSAKEGWQIQELRKAIENSIAWDKLPEVSSSQLFSDIKSFLLNVKNTGQLLAQVNYLYNDFICQHPNLTIEVVNLRDQFDTCIRQLENRDLIRYLTFGRNVLLQPELLDAYASAMVNAAKEEPDGLGSIAEEIALSGRFFVPEEQKIKDTSQEQLLLHATVEELICHDLALRENSNDGNYLVFPSQFNRDYEDAPEPKGATVSITFEGPVQSLYSTLAVRLGHSGFFTTGRAEMWRNAAIFTAKTGGKCGIFLKEFTDARGRMILFFDEQTSPETRFHFEEFILAHTKRRSLDGTLELVRFFICPECGDPVPDNYVKRLREKGKMSFSCPCGGVVSLAEPRERIRFQSEVEAMERSADQQRDFNAFIMSAKGETSTKSFQKWAGGEQVTLAIVFTDIVGSTALGEEIRDEAMNEVRRAHFVQSRKMIGKFKGQEIKTIGDSFMAAFKSVDTALDYARSLQRNTGHPKVQIRAGIHIGPMSVEEDDVFGGTVNFAARVIGTIKGEEIWLSDRAKEDIDRLGAAKYRQLCWERHDDVTMKGFLGVFTLWSVQ